MVSPVNAVFAARDATCSLSRCLWETCSLLASAAGLPCPVRALEAAQFAFAESSFVQVSSSTRLRAHALSHTRINHLPRRRARSRSVRQQHSDSSMHRQ